jgi:2-(1,2-epoxy-1,2-dihydrophenyl)acetyl-CoA isomerase
LYLTGAPDVVILTLGYGGRWRELRTVDNPPASERAMQYEHFDLETDGAIAYVRFIGPGALKLGDLSDEFLDLMLRLQEDQAVRVVLITDGDNAFELPQSLEGLAQERASEHGRHLLAGELESARKIITLVQELGKPVVTATRGAVANAGLGFFMAGDVRLAGATATFTVPDLASGLMPDWGLTFILPRLVGPGRTLDLLWNRRTIGAADAARIGLVDRVLADESWDDELAAYLERLASLPQPAVRLTKLAAQQAPQLDLTTMLSYEYEAQQQCWESQETSEGLAAWQQGRSPIFQAPRGDDDDEG